MNSRDAAYEEEQYELALRASLNDAPAGATIDANGEPVESVPDDVKIEEEPENSQAPRRKRKRTEEDT